MKNKNKVLILKKKLKKETNLKQKRGWARS